MRVKLRWPLVLAIDTVAVLLPVLVWRNEPYLRSLVWLWTNGWREPWNLLFALWFEARNEPLWALALLLPPILALNVTLWWVLLRRGES